MPVSLASSPEERPVVEGFWARVKVSSALSMATPTKLLRVVVLALRTPASTEGVRVLSAEATWADDRPVMVLRIIVMSADGLVILSNTAPTAASLELEVDPAPLKLLEPERVAVRTRLLLDIVPMNDTYEVLDVIVPGTLFTPVAVFITESVAPLGI